MIRRDELPPLFENQLPMREQPETGSKTTDRKRLIRQPVSRRLREKNERQEQRDQRVEILRFNIQEKTGDWPTKQS